MSYTNIFTKKKKEDSNQTLGNLSPYKRVLETGKQGGIGNYLVNSFNKQNTNSSVTPYATPKVTPNQYDKPIGPANQTQTNQAPDPVQSYFDKFKANATDRAYEQADYTNRANEQYTGQINEVYDNEATALKETMPSEENLNKNVERIRGSLGVARNRADVYKDNVETDTGRDLRQLAESKRTNDAQRKNIFAGNNTVDSYGVGGLDMEQSNADSVLLREQSESLRGKRQQLAEIDNQLLDLESKVEQTVNDEISNFEKTVQQINAQLRGNEMGRKQALQSAFSSLEEKLLGIRDQYKADSSELETSKLEFDMKQGDETYDFKSEDGLRNEFVTRVEKQNIYDVLNNYNKINNASNTGAGDLNLIFSYMKLLDPSSTVREGEFANAEQAAGYLSRLTGKTYRFTNGGRLAPETRQNFKDEAKGLFSNYQNTYNNLAKQYETLAQQRGLNPKNVTNVFSGIADVDTTSSPTTSAKDRYTVVSSE